jgi:segregation and condensation protein B
VDKGFLEPCGRLDAPGRPMQFQTTSAFLRVFGLESLDQLPAYGDASPAEEVDAAALAESLPEVRE